MDRPRCPRTRGLRSFHPPWHQDSGWTLQKRLKTTAARTERRPYYDSDKSPCARFADGIAIATYTSVGQRTLIIAPERVPDGALAVAIIRLRKGGPGFKYTIPMTALATLGPMNKNLDPRGRYDAVMAADGLFQVEPIQ